MSDVNTTTTTTLKSDMIVPEVFGDIVTPKFKGKLVIANFALTDTTLVGNPERLFIFKMEPIGDAEDLEEDVAMVPKNLLPARLMLLLRK